MTALELFEPGLWTRVGVSKPAGASVGNCGAFCAITGACSPNKEIKTTLFAVGQITSNQTSHLGNQTLRPRLR